MAWGSLSSFVHTDFLGQEQQQKKIKLMFFLS